MSSQGKFSSTTIALLIVGLVIGAGGGYFFASSSLQTKIDDYETQVTDLNSEVSSLEMEVERLEALLEAEAEEPFTFAKYGFSFEYPEGWVLSLAGFLETVATENSGVVNVVSEGDIQVYTVGWLSTIFCDESILDDMIDGGIEEVSTIVELGERVTSTKDGHMLKYQTFIEEGGETITFNWYCDESDYIFFTIMMFAKGHEPIDTISTMSQFLETFDCH